MKKAQGLSKSFWLLALVSMVTLLLWAALAGAQQYPILNRIADKVIQKYQNSTCEQLWQERSEPKPQMEQEFVQLLRSDSEMRAMFINSVTIAWVV